MRPSNIYEYLLQRHPYLPSILAVCGADKKYTGECASDFEKFRELCRVIVKLSGNKLFREINASVSELFGEEIQLSEGSCEFLWRKYCGEGKIAESVPPILKIRAVDTQILTAAVNLSGVNEFVKPDIYHVGLAREKRGNGVILSSRDSDMLKIQELREQAEKCKKDAETLLLDARGCNTDILCKAVHYLNFCGLLPKTAVIFDLNSICTDTLFALSAHEEISFCVYLDGEARTIDEQAEQLARELLIGVLYVCVPKDKTNEFQRAVQNRMCMWRNDGRAHADCLLEFERTETFY